MWETAVDQWTTEDVRRWLDDKKLGRYAPLFCDEHKIDGRALLMLSEHDLKNPPLQLQILGDIKRLVYFLSELQADHGHLLVNKKALNSAMLHRSMMSADSSESDAVDATERVRAMRGFAVNLRPERFKALLSMIYLLIVTWITSIVMVIVHDRVPDMNKYPPLPDIFLDNIPHIPWAFHISELCGSILLLIWLSVLLFHKHRFILFRRFNSLCGTVYLLRCVTMLITSLSVPGIHLSCAPREYSNWYAKFNQAFVIWHNVGLSIRGVRSCGDYMFSGHTVALTMMNFFITEYTPRRLYWLHTFTWLLNIFGIFFILSAHEHYSIDVFIAFYITSRLFMYYHTLSNNSVAHKCPGKRRTRVWFPMFSYFEARVSGAIPNEFGWPLTADEVCRACVRGLARLKTSALFRVSVDSSSDPCSPVDQCPNAYSTRETAACKRRRYKKSL